MSNLPYYSNRSYYSDRKVAKSDVILLGIFY